MPLFELISTYVPAVIHINILYYCMVLNGKMGEPNAYLNKKIVGQHIAKLLLVNDFKPMVKASK